MMSFPLLRLPFLAIREVINSMDTREIFLLSLASKRSQNLVMLSIPKNALLADFTFKKDGFRFELMPKIFSKGAANILPVAPYITEKESVFTSFSTHGRYVQCDFSSPSEISEVEKSIRKLFYSFLKTFKKSKIYMKFQEGTGEEFAMEMIKFAWENGFRLDHIDFCMEQASPESIQELLNGCHKHHTSLCMEARLPEGFKCTPPPGGYKIESLTVHYAHWVDLDDFLQCRKVLFIIGFPDLTVEYLNGLLKKIVNLECRLENFFFKVKSIKPTDFEAIVEGLSESEIEQDGAWQGLKFERKDGLKLRIALDEKCLDLENDVDNFWNF